VVPEGMLPAGHTNHLRSTTAPVWHHDRRLVVP
jgi:hypothetical protein